MAADSMDGDNTATGSADAKATDSASATSKKRFQETMLKKQLTVKQADSATDSENYTENDLNTSSDWLSATATPTPTPSHRSSLKRDLMLLKSALSPKYWDISDSDDTTRSTRRRNHLTLNSSSEVHIKDNQRKTPTRTVPTVQLYPNSTSFISPIDKLLIKNGASSPNSTGFEADAEEAATQPQRRQIKRKQKRVSKSKVPTADLAKAVEKVKSPEQVKENSQDNTKAESPKTKAQKTETASGVEPLPIINEADKKRGTEDDSVIDKHEETMPSTISDSGMQDIPKEYNATDTIEATSSELVEQPPEEHSLPPNGSQVELECTQLSDPMTHVQVNAKRERSSTNDSGVQDTPKEDMEVEMINPSAEEHAQQTARNQVLSENESQVDILFTQPAKTSTEVKFNSKDASKSPSESLESSRVIITETENSIKSPSSISIDSAKGSSIINDSSWPTYQVGDLYWGRLFSFCYWPCMVCPDPTGQIVGNMPTHSIRKSLDNTPLPIQVHVRFFADNARRNWIKQENLLAFAGLKAYEALREEVRIKYGMKNSKYRQMVPKMSKLATWHKALEEAKMVDAVPYAERLEKFYQIYESSITTNKQKRKRTNSMLPDTALSTSDVGSSLYDSTDNLYAKPLLLTTVKRERSESPYSPAFSPVKTNHQPKRRKLIEVADVPASAGTENLPVTPPSTDPHNDLNWSGSGNLNNAEKIEFQQLFEAVKDYVMVHKQDDKVEKCVLAVVRNIWSLKQLQLRERERDTANDQETAVESAVETDAELLERAVESRASAVESLESASLDLSQVVGSKRLSQRLKTLKARRSNTPIIPPRNAITPLPRERAISEQPKVKKVMNRPIDEVIEDIMRLDRKSLFKGVSREPVCKYCYEPGGNLKRCARNCNNWLHDECLDRHKAGPTFKINKKGVAVKPLTKDEALSNASTPLNSASPISDVELHVTAEAESQTPIVCHECETNAPDPCCICHQVLAVPTTPPTSPIKATNNDDEPTTSAAAFAKGMLEDPHKLLACNHPMCNRKFHPSCCKYWPQASITKNNIRCPMHVCHTCVSDDPQGKYQQLSHTKLAKCVKCPATYHIDGLCIPAGSRILTMTHIICPRHYTAKGDKNLNVLWCYICVKGGELLCCETCPIAVHARCRNIPIKPHESYICEECESGRLPLYGEIVWAKFNYFRWWPAIILPPSEIPSNILKKAHGPNDFVVRFFGTHDHGWISRRRVYLYIEGDEGDSSKTKSHLDAAYAVGVVEASRFMKIIKAHRQEQAVSHMASSKMHPPHYVRIKANKPVPPVRFVYNEEDVSVCECKPDQENPCGPESGCLNRMLYHECNPEFCPAGNRCENRMFETRKSPRFDVVYMNQRGFGLVCREPIAEGSFVVEYVGEVINRAEFRQRLEQKSRNRDENYYFLGVEPDFIIDAGPKGNLARFMNHSCEPNCETQKWNVNSINRVGLFAIKDIPADTELTFNYLWDDLMNGSKKACFCGAERCSGNIGGKLKDEPTKEINGQQSNNKVISKLKPLKRLQNGKASSLRIRVKGTKKIAGKKPKAKHINADDEDGTIT
ncbi:probable histone-lysine N-methyltransferase Mes-4 isoform X2 [Scaptodrosophila lebanonensis]|uniref:Probable histone-lysine N-methyltransferase Mes-4 isoform X2 n=1 Tax=Drosophila lebanonensis TaxID=7225 RepID=A0A6J2T3D3_DROLE|nr:probable histone-lysine N-methyltransferase Mes-4 isoform X2 [Scaptodrosophila lebanonensis]